MAGRTSSSSSSFETDLGDLNAHLRCFADELRRQCTTVVPTKVVDASDPKGTVPSTCVSLCACVRCTNQGTKHRGSRCHVVKQLPSSSMF